MPSAGHIPAAALKGPGHGARRRGRSPDAGGELYRHEEHIRETGLSGEEKRAYRQAKSAPLVALFWRWCDQQCQRLDLTPSNPLSKALKYAMARVEALEVFLDNPEVAIDTNHLERGLRCVPMGKKNWLFCWTEAGAEEVAIIQSLIATCRLHEVSTFDYLVDVLQRISVHRPQRFIC